MSSAPEDRFASLSSCPRCLTEISGAEQWGPYFPARHALAGECCSRCGGQLELVFPTREDVNVFTLDAGVQVFSHTRVPEHIKAQSAPELLRVIESMLAFSHATVSPLNAITLWPSLVHAPGTLANRIITNLPPRLKSGLYRCASSMLSITNGEVCGARAFWTGLGLDAMYERARAENTTQPMPRLTSLDLMEWVLPGKPEDTWPPVLELTLAECCQIHDEISALRKQDIEPQVLGDFRLVLVPGPDRIRVHPLEQIGDVDLQSQLGEAQTIAVTANLLAPRTVSLRSAIDELEDLINRPNLSETRLQLFFENHPFLLLGTDYKRLRRELCLEPQFVLTGDDVGNLRPDFFLERIDSPLWDILELKLPNVDILKGMRKRRGFTAYLKNSLDQLREYYQFFSDTTNRQWFRQRYGLDVFCPNLCLVIGRSHQFANAIERRKLELDLSAGRAPVRLVTYDDLLVLARSREIALRSQTKF